MILTYSRIKYFPTAIYYNSFLTDSGKQKGMQIFTTGLKSFCVFVGYCGLLLVPLYLEQERRKSRKAARKFPVVWGSNISVSSLIYILQAKIRKFLLSFVPVVMRTR